MDLQKRRHLIESYLSLGGPPPGEEILTEQEQDQLRRARELDPDPDPPQIDVDGKHAYDFRTILALIHAVRGNIHMFNIGPLFEDVAFGGCRLVKMRPTEAFRELLIIERRRSIGPVSTVDIREFFDGNDDPASIASTLTSQGAMFDAVRAALVHLAAHPEVLAVGAEIDELPNLEHPDDNDMWPVAGRVFVWTGLTLRSLRALLKPLRPDSMDKVPLRSARPPAGRSMPPRTKVFQIQWD